MHPGTFFFPGPTEVRREVLEAMVRQPMSHRSSAFERIYADGERGLQTVLRTTRRVLMATASGTGMMEAAVRAAPPGRMLCVVNGAFGERFVRIAHACGRDADRVDFEWGAVPDVATVRERLSRAQYATMTLVHSETSTGVLSDVPALVRAAHDAGAVAIVDSVSGAGGARLEVDAWGIDCLVTASQKGLALPPGLAFASVSDSFLEHAQREGRGVYLDLVQYAEHARTNQTPTTPAVSLFYALEVQASAIEREGMDAREARHQAMQRATETWVSATRDALDLELGILAPPGARTPTVTVITLPSGLAGSVVVRATVERGYVIGTGFGPLRDRCIRIGHMGDHTVESLAGCLRAVGDALASLRD